MQLRPDLCPTLGRPDVDCGWIGHSRVMNDN